MPQRTSTPISQRPSPVPTDGGGPEHDQTLSDRDQTSAGVDQDVVHADQEASTRVGLAELAGAETPADVTARGDAELYRVKAERVTPVTAPPARGHRVSVGVGA